MGMDLFVCSDTPVRDSAQLPSLRPWLNEGDGWVCRNRGWQVVLNKAESLDSLQHEKVRAMLAHVCPEALFVTCVNVEGRQTNEAILIAVWTAQRIAFHGRGAVYDPQQDTLILPFSAGLWDMLEKARQPEP